MIHRSTQAPDQHLRSPRRKAREKVAGAIRQGRLVRQPCERCGSEEKTDAHHSDYTKPLQVEWLCHNCHEAEHADMRRAIGAATAKAFCAHGHEMIGSNIRYLRGKRHSCRKCRNIQDNARRKRRRHEAKGLAL